MSRKLIVGLGVALVACVIIMAIGLLFGGGLQPSPEATPTSEIWILEAPIGTHALFGEDALTDESCVDCPAYDLVDGTQLTPLEGGCQQASWDPSYIYCHVRVLDGEYAGYEGWVNERFIRK